MENLYEVLRVPTVENLKAHQITFFDEVIKKYPDHYQEIIGYINECYNYNSPYLIDEKDWTLLTIERFRSNNVPESLRGELTHLEDADIVFAISSFVAYQKQATWVTYTAKQNLRIGMLALMQKPAASTVEKKNANEMVSSLDIELNEIREQLQKDQKRFGNYKGMNELTAAKTRLSLNIAYHIEE